MFDAWMVGHVYGASDIDLAQLVHKSYTRQLSSQEKAEHKDTEEVRERSEGKREDVEGDMAERKESESSSSTPPQPDVSGLGATHPR